jgi:CHAT domain-containing protein
MPTSRNLRWVLLCLVVLTGMAIVLWLRIPAKEVKKPVTPEVKIVGTVQKLEQGKPLEGDLKGGEGHAYEVDLKAGDYAYVIADQKGIDVAVRLIGPDGHLIVRVDSPNGAKGPEPMHEIAEVAGTYRFEVVSEDSKAASGKYEIRLQELHPAKETDQKRTSAERMLIQGGELRRSGRDGMRRALAVYQESLPLWKELGLKDREAEALFRIGWISRDLGDADGTISALEQALPLFQKTGDHTREGIVLNFLSTAYLQRGDLDAATDRASRALAVFREQKDPELEASALNIQASAFYAGGQTQKALDAYQGALALARTAKSLPEESVALYGIGDIRTDQGKPESALDALEQALEIHRSLNSARDAANTRRRIADVLQQLHRLDEALANLQKALSSYKNLGDVQGQAITLSSIGTVNLLSGKTPEAGAAYQEALSLARQIKDPYNEAIALSNMGRYAYALGDARQSLSWHDQAVARAQSIGNASAIQTSALFGSARALHDLGDFKAAQERLEQVRKNVELLRGEADSLDLRTSYFASKQHYYDLQIDVLMHLQEAEPQSDYAAKAFEVNESRRARGLLEMLAESKKMRNGADPSLTGQESALQQRINALDSSLLDARERQETQKISLLEKQQRELLAELDKVQTEIRRNNPLYAALSRPEPLTLDQVRKSVLERKTHLLVYSLGEERSFLWSIPQQGEIKTFVLPARSLIEDTARKAYDQFRHRRQVHGGPAPWAKKLSEMLIKPVIGDLLTQRLVIIADGALQYLPFAALPDPRSPQGQEMPLVVNHEIVSLPSASVLYTLRRELWDRDLAPRRVAIVADPVFSADDPRLGGHGAAVQASRSAEDSDLSRSAQDLGLGPLERLPFTEEEAAAIRDLVIEDQRFEALGFDANRSTVLGGALKRYRVLHFATHGLLNARHPELSGLVLSRFDAQGTPQEGFLRSYEILNLDLRAELAVLSACETGLGAEVRGEGLVGLTQSFMYAGVPRVIVSLWNVSDHGTAELMSRFYRALFRHHLAPSAALRCAQLSMIKLKVWEDPYYWAPFIFQGEWNLDVASSDGGIETQPSGSQTPPRANNDLPPPTFGPPAGCPDLN